MVDSGKYWNEESPMANTGNTQQIIDYGVAPNDGTGDPLRTAFIKTDENFSNIWLAGPVGSNITITNNTIQVNDTNGNLLLKPNGVGIVETKGSILPDFDELRDLGSPSRRFRSIYFNGTLDTTSNLSVENLTVNNSLNLDGNVVIAGNLTVNGTTLTVNVANLSIADKNIILANGSPDANTANGAGITVAGANAQLTYYNNTNSWNFNKNLISEELFSVGGFVEDGWDFITQTGGGFLSFPSGASWQSQVNLDGTSDEYIRSAVNGYINISTYDSTTDLASEIDIEHGLIRLKIYNGVNVEWSFLEDGTFNAAGTVDCDIVKTRPTVTASLLLATQAGAGARAMVTDADARTWGNLLVGGAGNTVPVWSDGSNWYIG